MNIYSISKRHLLVLHIHLFMITKTNLLLFYFNFPLLIRSKILLTQSLSHISHCCKNVSHFRIVQHIIIQLKQLTIMKGRKMHTPVVTEVYQQKLMYHTHLKKLQKIREQRKNQLVMDAHRLTRHEQIKNSKSKSFAHKYNEQNQQIAQQNVKLLNKLQKVRPFTRYSSFSAYEKEEIPERTIMTPFRKRRIAETEKENSRIFVKVKSASSNLSKDKFLKDYARSQQIRTRIARYATQNNKICLKSQKFINMSHQKINTAAHYNHQEILKNKIDNPIEAIKQRKLAETERKYEEDEVFATEPVRMRQKSKKYRI